MRSPPIKLLEVQKIRTDGGKQVHHENPCVVVVQEYAELTTSGAEFPAVRTWFDKASYWLVDGFQRLAESNQLVGPLPGLTTTAS